MRFLPLSALLAVASAVGGCFQSATILKVNADGSGTIEQRTLITDAGLSQLRAFTIMGGGAGKDLDLLSEQQARSLAPAIGPGVTYVSSMPIKTVDAQGRDAVYAFSDVTQLRISEQPPAPGGISIGGRGTSAGAEHITFAFTPQPDGSRLLRILVPQPSILRIGMANGSGNGPVSLDQLGMAKQFLAGAQLSIAVEPAGRLVRTSSPYVDGQRVTLLDVDLDRVLNDETVVARLQGAKSPDEAKAALKDMPGLKINLDPEITIEFTPEK